MALFKNKGDYSSRASQIISEIEPKRKENVSEGEETKVEDPEGEDIKVEVPEGEETKVEAPKSDLKDKGEETPKVETPEGEETKVEEPPTEPDVLLKPETPEITEQAMFSYLSEKLNRKIESVDDLTISEELDPEVRQLIEWQKKTGLSLSKWSDYNRDFSKVGDMELAREIRAREYPNLNSEELEYSLKEFIYNEESDDETEKIQKSIALKKFAQDGRRQLEANQLKLVSSETKALTSQQEKDLGDYQKIKDSQGDVEASNAQYSQGVSKAVMSLKALNLKLSDDLTIEHNISEGDKNPLAKMIVDMPDWYNSNGSMNFSNVVKDGLKIRDFDTIMKKAYEQGLSVGKESKIKEDNNITIDTQTSPPHSGEGQKKGNIGDVIDAIAGKNSKKLRFGRVEN